MIFALLFLAFLLSSLARKSKEKQGNDEENEEKRSKTSVVYYLTEMIREFVRSVCYTTTLET